MRHVGAALLAAGLLVTSVMAGASAQPMAPGRPAGVKQARMTANQTALMIGTGAVIMAGVGILISGSSAALGTNPIASQNNIVAPPVSTTSTTS